MFHQQFKSLYAKPKDLELDQFDWNYLAYCACLGKAALSRRNILFTEGLPKEKIFRPPPEEQAYQLCQELGLDDVHCEWPRFSGYGLTFDFSCTEGLEPFTSSGEVVPDLDKCEGPYDDLINKCTH